MTRYPPFYYTKMPMHGQLEYDGQAIWPGKTCYQGEVATFDFHLPESPAGASLMFLVKKLREAENLLWESAVSKNAEGTAMYKAAIPHTVTALMYPGTYYFSVTESIGGAPRTTIVEGTFNIELTVASPNPRRAITDGEITTAGDSRSATSLTTTERTLPNTPDIGQRA